VWSAAAGAGAPTSSAVELPTERDVSWAGAAAERSSDAVCDPAGAAVGEVVGGVDPG
jgi:hypothetical protein